MKRVSIIAVSLLFLAFLFVGCSKTERTIFVPGGRAKVTTKRTAHGQAQTVEFAGKGGKTTITNGEGQTVTEAELGVPVYPGAKVEMSQKSKDQQSGGKSMEQYMLSTSDGFDKVVAFYKPVLKDVQSSNTMDMGGEKMALFAMKKGDIETTLHIMSDSKKKITTIQVIKTGK
jgi:hypothetical protein